MQAHLDENALGSARQHLATAIVPLYPAKLSIIIQEEVEVLPGYINFQIAACSRQARLRTELHTWALLLPGAPGRGCLCLCLQGGLCNACQGSAGAHLPASDQLCTN